MAARSPSPDLPFEVLRLANAVVRELGSVTARHGLTPQQAAILFRVAAADRAPTLAALARSLSVSKQNVTGMVARLVEGGWLGREGDPDDQRASRLELTRRGAELVRRLRPAVGLWTADWLDRVPPGERASATASIGAMLRALAPE